MKTWVIIFLLISLSVFPSKAQAAYYPLFEPSVPNELSISVNGLDYRKFVKRLLEAQRNPVIPEASKKKFKGTLSLLNKNGEKIQLKGKIRINGDLGDHIDLKNTFSSLHVSLADGHIGNITKFKLLLPRTRNGENEVFWIALLRSYGFPVPFTKFITVHFNNVPHRVIFQEVMAKEFLERHRIRETVIVEGDERQFWEAARKRAVYGDGVKYPTYAYKKIDNKNFLENQIDTNYRLFIALKGINKVHHLEFLETQERFLHMENGPFFYQINKKYAPHGLLHNNLKYAYDPLFNSLIPLYYDGAVDFSACKDIESDPDPTGTSKKNLPIKKYLKEQIRSLNLNLSKSYACVAADVLKTAERLDHWKHTAPLKQRVEPFQRFDRSYKREIHPGIDGEVPLLVFIDGNFRECRFQAGLFEFHEAGCEVLPLKRVMQLLAGDAKPTKKKKEKIYSINLGIIKGDQPATHKSDIFLNIPSSPFDRTIRINPKKNLFLDFAKSHESRKIKLLMDKGQSSRVILSGHLGSNDSIELSGSQGGEGLLSNLPPGRFNERLLTGCLTVVDATLNGPRFFVEGANCEDGVNFIRSNGYVEQIFVKNSRHDAVDADFSDLTIAHISVEKAGNDCIDLSAGTYSLGNLILSECADKALSAGEKSKVSITSLRATQAKIFIASKDESSVRLAHGLGLEINGKCIDIYSKKKEFDSGTFKGKNYSCEITEISPNK